MIKLIDRDANKVIKKMYIDGLGLELSEHVHAILLNLLYTN